MGVQSAFETFDWDQKAVVLRDAAVAAGDERRFPEINRRN